MVTRVAVWGVCAHMRERVHELVPTHEACGGEVFTIGCSFPFRTGALREGLSSEEAEVEEGGDQGSPHAFVPHSRPGWTTSVSLLVPQLDCVRVVRLYRGEVTLWDRV